MEQNRWVNRPWANGILGELVRGRKIFGRTYCHSPLSNHSINIISAMISVHAFRFHIAQNVLMILFHFTSWNGFAVLLFFTSHHEMVLSFYSFSSRHTCFQQRFPLDLTLNWLQSPLAYIHSHSYPLISPTIMNELSNKWIFYFI